MVVGRCIEFEACRYNRAMIKSELVLRLMPYVEFFPVCMEAEHEDGRPSRPGEHSARRGPSCSAPHRKGPDGDGFALHQEAPGEPPGRGRLPAQGSLSLLRNKGRSGVSARRGKGDAHRKIVRNIRPGGFGRPFPVGGGGRGPFAQRTHGGPLPHPHLHLGPLPGVPGEGNAQSVQWTSTPCTSCCPWATIRRPCGGWVA